MDKDLKLWLIEVNMSPACAERQPWLVDMLDDMADGVASMIAHKVNNNGRFPENLDKIVQGT